MVFFIPWRVVAEDSGAAHLDLLGPPGRCSGWWPHDGDVAAGGDFVLAILRFGADDGARAIGATDAAAAVEVRGRRRRRPGSNAALREGLRRALSPTFRAGEMVFFIPWRLVAEESGAAHLDLLGPPGRAGADFHFSSPSGLAGPTAHETLLLCGCVVGTEVGILLVRLSPTFSWTRGSWNTSDCRHGPSSVPEHAS